MVTMCVGAISITTNAAWGGIFDSNDNMNFQDTLHGKHLYTDSSFSVSLNQYTSGMPISGTRIGGKPRLLVMVPCGSASINKTFLPCRAMPMPILMVDIVLPTPPFWFAMAITSADKYIPP